MRSPRVIIYHKYPGFGRKAHAIADLLRRRDLAVETRTLLTLRDRIRMAMSMDLWIGFWNGTPARYFPRHYIFFNAEPLGVTKWRENRAWFDVMRGAVEVWDYNRANAQYVEPLGVRYRHVPFGYAPYYESSFQENTRGRRLEQGIDVLFVGEVSERRRRILEALSKTGVSVRVISPDSPVYGGDLDLLLASAKIVLGIHYFEEPGAQIADLARLDHLLSNRLFVIHERPAAIRADAEFERNVTTCDYAQIVDTCLHYLGRPEARSGLALSAHEWFKRCYSMDALIPYEQIRRFLLCSEW
jgi:hypothetical protein